MSSWNQKPLKLDFEKKVDISGFARELLMYARIFNEELNLSFFVPKKDQSELFVGYNNATEEEKKVYRRSMKYIVSKQIYSE